MKTELQVSMDLNHFGYVDGAEFKRNGYQCGVYMGHTERQTVALVEGVRMLRGKPHIEYFLVKFPEPGMVGEKDTISPEEIRSSIRDIVKKENAISAEDITVRLIGQSKN